MKRMYKWFSIQVCEIRNYVSTIAQLSKESIIFIDFSLIEYSNYSKMSTVYLVWSTYKFAYDIISNVFINQYFFTIKKSRAKREIYLKIEN